MTLLKSLGVGMALLLAACVTPTRWEIDPHPDMARLDTIRLMPVAFTTTQAFDEDRERIDAVLREELTESLGRKGYQVVPATESAEGVMQITLTYIWDERLYPPDHPVLVPEVRLYADVKLIRQMDGSVLLKGETLGIGRVDFPAPVPHFGPYTEPQYDLAGRISALFPSRNGAVLK